MIQQQRNIEFDFIGLLLKCPELMPAVQNIWRFEEPFTDGRLNIIFDQMKAEYVSTGDIKNVSFLRRLQKETQKSRTFELSFISELKFTGCFPEQLGDLLNEIRSRMIIRYLSGTINGINHSITTGEGVNGMEVLQFAFNEVSNIQNNLTFETEVTIPEALKSICEKAKKAFESTGISEDYLPTGFQSLDREIIGLERGQMVLIGARPSVGKTSFALSIAKNMDIRGVRVGFISCEMSVQDLVQRVLQQRSGVNFKDISRKKEVADLQKLYDESKQFSRSRIVFKNINNDRRLSNLLLQMRRMKKNHPDMEVIFIDYVQKIESDKKGHNESSEIAKISGLITDMAKQLDVVVVALCQLNRDADPEKRPQMRMLKGSGALEQDADLIMFVHRSLKGQMRHNEFVQDCELILAKGRDSGTGIFPMKFEKKITNFYDQIEMPLNNGVGEI